MKRCVDVGGGGRGVCQGPAGAACGPICDMKTWAGELRGGLLACATCGFAGPAPGWPRRPALDVGPSNSPLLSQHEKHAQSPRLPAAQPDVQPRPRPARHWRCDQAPAVHRLPATPARCVGTGSGRSRRTDMAKLLRGCSGLAALLVASGWVVLVRPSKSTCIGRTRTTQPAAYQQCTHLGGRGRAADVSCCSAGVSCSTCCRLQGSATSMTRAACRADQAGEPAVPRGPVGQGAGSLHGAGVGGC